MPMYVILRMGSNFSTVVSRFGDGGGGQGDPKWNRLNTDKKGSTLDNYPPGSTTAMRRATANKVFSAMAANSTLGLLCEIANAIRV